MNLFSKKGLVILLVISLVAFSLVGCGGNQSSEGQNGEDGLSGKIKIDGSSTVFPITEAMAEEFQIANKGVQVTVGVSGTGGGMKRFTVGDTDISDASRPIKDSEAEIAQENGIEFTRLQVGVDGISVCVNPQNDWVEDLTVEDLNKIWAKDSSVEKWSDLNSEWPDKEISLYGPGTDSGTFDYFTETILGEDGEVTTDFIPSEDDNVLVQGIAGDKYSLGYFGYSYYEANQNKLKAVSIHGVMPTPETIENGEYTPLSRPLFIYINDEYFKTKPQVQEFIKFYLNNARAIVPSTGYVPLSEENYQKQLDEIMSK